MVHAATNEDNINFVLTLPDSDQTIRVVGTPQNPQWVAADVCKVLRIKQASRAVEDFDDDEKGVITIHTLGGVQELLAVTEAGLYRLIFQSRKPEAKRFQKWVFSEVLPSIRQHGCYPAPANPVNATAVMLRQLALQVEAQERLEAEQKVLAYRVDDVENRLDGFNGDTGYRTLVGFAREQGFRMPLRDSIRHGKALAKIHKERGVRIGRVPDEKYSTINSYRLDILREYFQAMG